MYIYVQEMVRCCQNNAATLWIFNDSESHNGLSLMPNNDLSLYHEYELDVSGQYLREYFKCALNFLWSTPCVSAPNVVCNCLGRSSL